MLSPLAFHGRPYWSAAVTVTRFVDASAGDYRLRDDSPLLKDGFKSLPTEKMGLQTERMKAKAAKRRARQK
jgi:hypothetical protein